MVRTIALMNQKGGVGKTTTTVNLAAGIARLGRRVLVIDLDPQGHATLHLGVTPHEEGGPTRTVYDLLLDPSIPAEECATKVRDNLWLMPAETDLAAAESELASEPDRLTRLATALRAMNARGFPADESTKPASSGGASGGGNAGTGGAGGFDVILLDCPPSLGLLTLNGLCAAREVFIPMQAHFLALQGVSKLLETVSLVGRSANPKLAVTGVILCMHDANTTHTKEVVADLDGFFEQAREAPLAPGEEPAPWRSARVYRPAIRRNIKLAECPSFGKTIFEYDDKCPGATDYLELAKKIVAEWDRVVAKRTGSTPAANAARDDSTSSPAIASAPNLEPVVRPVNAAAEHAS